MYINYKDQEDIKEIHKNTLGKLLETFKESITEHTRISPEFCRLNLLYPPGSIKRKYYTEEEIQVLSKEIYHTLMRFQYNLKKDIKESARQSQLLLHKEEILRALEEKSEELIQSSLNIDWNKTRYRQIKDSDLKYVCYDMHLGTLVEPRTGHKVIWDNSSGYGTIYGLQPARVAWYCVTGVNPKENIGFLDGDLENLAPGNIYGVSSGVTLDRYITEDTLTKECIKLI